MSEKRHYVVEILSHSGQIVGWINERGGGVCVGRRELATIYTNVVVAKHHAKSATTMATQLVEVKE